MLYICSIKDLTQEDLFQIGVGKFERNLFELGLSDGDAIIIKPNAIEDFDGVLSSSLTGELINAIHNFENKFAAGNELGKYVGDENNGHFLSLRIKFGARAYTAKPLPELRNVGVNFKTLFPYGENAVLWTRDAYFNFIMDYMLYCEDMPEHIFDEIMSNYDNTKIDSILFCIEKANKWYQDSTNQLFVNTVMNDPYEAVLEILKKIFKKYKFENECTNKGNSNMAVLIEPMRYGNKDSRSGCCIVDALPKTMDIDLYNTADICYKGVFFPQTQNIPPQDNNFENLKINFSNDNFGFSEIAEADIKMFSTLLLQHEMHMASTYGKEIKDSVIKEIIGMRIHFIIESGRAYSITDLLIPRINDEKTDTFVERRPQSIKTVDYGGFFSDETITLKALLLNF